MSDDVLANFLLEPHIGVIATLHQGGQPYSVPVWWLHDDGVIWLTGTTKRIWCKQLKADPRCSLCIEALTPVAGHVGIDRKVEALELPTYDIWPQSRALAKKYIGREDPDNRPAD